MTLDKTSLTSKDSEASASETLMSSHAMKMGLYTINLGTKLGNYEQRSFFCYFCYLATFFLLKNHRSKIAYCPYVDFTPDSGFHFVGPKFSNIFAICQRCR